MDYHNFKLTKNPVKKDNPEFALLPELDRLTERQLRYVMLVDWFRSPLRLMDIEARKLKAAVMSGYKLERDGTRLDMNGRNLIAGKVGNVEAARRVFHEIQYDEEREAFNALNNQIRDTIQFLNKKDKTLHELEKASKMAKELPILMEARKKLLEIISFRQPFDENSVIADIDTFNGNESVSLLEELLEEDTEE